MTIGLHPLAEAEFAAEVDYYEAKQTGLGLRFYQEVMATLEWIAANPQVPRLRKNYRRVNLKVFPFYVAYVVSSDRIWVLAVAHGWRRPDYWKRRMD